MEYRILLLAVKGRDAAVIAQLLAKAGHESLICDSCRDLAREGQRGAAVAVVTEESLLDDDTAALDGWLSEQPSWSDFPFILLATKRAGRRPRDALKMLRQLGNVVVLERPVHSETLASAVNSAMRGRSRQYEARRHLEELQSAEGRLTSLNGSLEARIAERTGELSSANNQLMQEVAERERAQAALAQSQKMEAVGQLTGGIAHDFNNLLTVIFGNLELIQRRTEDEKTARLADFARQAAERAAKLTHQLLAFSRTQNLTLKAVDLNALVTGMHDLLGRTIGPMVRIEMALDATGPWALADDNQLELAILNLSINARDAMPDGGVLTIATGGRPAEGRDLAPGDYAVISVRDTGSGIPGHLLSKVFDPFFTTKPIGKGTGLGLSQVYGIAQQSGGTVRLSSVEGQGSTVEIWLPAAEATLPAPEDAFAADARADGPHKRILVVDDDADVRRFIVDCLQSLGYSVDEAAEGRSALRRLKETPPDLLIVDYAMPGMTGVDVVMEARASAPALPIIMATGYADMEAVDRVMPPESLLRKPFRLAELATAVRRALVPSTA
ncbi:MAG: response regulator [Alphaproteobacteria bacterium]|nr:response regulator [Alphaproteobacteria bacterium]MBU2042818.1 response regulator [Alphaproteobacteria bacterium]MBU2125314.1 response regulator [Alphaproteobacteria bacterium]MBU2207998.1 response regulator [Alphaproteobacteria bacterium]MBU2289533.1 response regulator [Alphaproteobacteria bacterium]